MAFGRGMRPSYPPPLRDLKQSFGRVCGVGFIYFRAPLPLSSSDPHLLSHFFLSISPFLGVIQIQGH